MVLRVNPRGWRSLRQLLLGYTPEDMAAFLAIRDSWRAGREAARNTRRTGIGGAAVGGFVEGLASPDVLTTGSVRNALQEPDLRQYASRRDVAEARRAMKAKRDARLGR